MTLLELQNVNRRFGGLQAVSEVSFSVNEGQIKAIIGPNGAGKTTLFNLIAGNLPADSGAIRFQGREISGLKPYQIARLGLSRTYQNLKLFHGMTALENVMVGRHLQSRSGYLAGMFNLPWTWPEEKRVRLRSMELLEMFDLVDLADTEVSALSFGQQRGVEFARALATEPTLLLLDEPAAGLNIYETAEIGQLIRRIRDQGITVLLVEHDMSLVMEISDEIVVLSFGEKIAEGMPAAIQQNQDVINVYLGDGE